ncbi:MAG: phenylacetate-CoA oxygenase subunit PaaJ, partial [Salibacteraceae bacterium]|nr:phenylacetate-CoA oxygenase subunit PaaJ [Salibacteraceae bacterium]
MVSEEKTVLIWEILQNIPDPEIPVISVVELGVIRKVELSDSETLITITPTYSGCPAMKVFEDDIIKTLEEKGYPKVKIKTVFSPAWSTDWMSEVALQKLLDFGIAPPQKGTNDKGVLFESGPKEVPCPQCKSAETKLLSQFGSTACKAAYTCSNCG